MSDTVYIINGPNLNLVGTRETNIYGTQNMDEFINHILSKHNNVKYYQSNIEGELVNKLQEIGFEAKGIILNAGGYTHTSITIADCIKAISTTVVEVHISNILAREEFRKTSVIASVCKGSISGLGLRGYELALQYFME